jgi:broad specificity phosphatase PhoE
MSTIYVMRHAEKPGGTDQGVNKQVDADAESLIPRGWQRAGALAAFFESKQGLPAPDNVYAAGISKEKVAPHVKVGSKSARPVGTVAPLAAKLNLVPVVSHSLGDEAALVAEVVKLNGTTLIC